MCQILSIIRVTIWTLQKKSYKRVETLAEIRSDFYTSQLLPPNRSYKQIAKDALDLCYNLRGCGWNWSADIHIPSETRPTRSTAVFMAATLRSFVVHFLLTDIVYYSGQWLAPSVTSTPNGDSIFDLSLPPAHRYIKSTTMTFLMLSVTYCYMQMAHLVGTALGVLVLGQDSSLWPPGFDAPWRSTSVAEFWGRRWHQFFRESIVSAGGYPLSLVAGRFGGLVGTFVMSGIVHDIGLWGMSGSMDPRNVIGTPLAIALVIISERLWRKYTGFRVGGPIGWLWTVAWILGSGNPLVDAWARHGVLGSCLIPVPLRLSILVLGPPHKGLL
jgi:hypothetical protein